MSSIKDSGKKIGYIHPPTTWYANPAVCSRRISTRRERQPGPLFTDVFGDETETEGEYLKHLIEQLLRQKIDYNKKEKQYKELFKECEELKKQLDLLKTDYKQFSTSLKNKVLKRKKLIILQNEIEELKNKVTYLSGTIDTLKIEKDQLCVIYNDFYKTIDKKLKQINNKEVLNEIMDMLKIALIESNSIYFNEESEIKIAIKNALNIDGINIESNEINYVFVGDQIIKDKEKNLIKNFRIEQ